MEWDREGWAIDRIIRVEVATPLFACSSSDPTPIHPAMGSRASGRLFGCQVNLCCWPPLHATVGWAELPRISRWFISGALRARQPTTQACCRLSFMRCSTLRTRGEASPVPNRLRLAAIPCVNLRSAQGMDCIMRKVLFASSAKNNVRAKKIPPSGGTECYKFRDIRFCRRDKLLGKLPRRDGNPAPTIFLDWLG